jgi:hypothetical protein
MDYLENGDKVRNAGFVKIELINGVCNLQFNINGLLPTDTMQREVWITDGAKDTEIGNLQLEKGKGVLTLKGLSADGLGRERIPYENLYEIYIPITRNREVRCSWGERKRLRKNTQQPILSKTTNQTASTHEIAEEQNWKKSTGEPTENNSTATPGHTVGEQTISSQHNAAQSIDSKQNHIQSIYPQKIKMQPTKIQKPNLQETKMQPTKIQQPNLQQTKMQPIKEQPLTQPHYAQDHRERENCSNTQYHCESSKIAPSVDKEVALETLRGGNRDLTLPQQNSFDRAIGSNSVTKNNRSMIMKEATKEVTGLQNREAGGRIPIRIQEDKWKQLSYLYPHIAPFQDDRDFLSIGPNDFVILHRSFHKLVNNSFLLHGYYNYDHLILVRRIKRNMEHFYIGVPGNFYEKETQVAIMYGFESFECKTEPAQEGDFGYYLIQVDI